MKAVRTLSVVVVLVLTAMPVWAAVSQQRSESASDGANWVVSKQSSDGQFFKTADGPDQKAPGTADALIAIVSGGASGDPVNKAVSYIEGRGMQDADTGPHTGQIILGLFAADADTADYSAKLDTYYDEEAGAWDESSVYGDALAALAHAALHDTLPQDAIDFLVEHQCDDNGWGFDDVCEFGSDTNSTAVVLMALRAGGVATTNAAITSGRQYLLDAQNDAGGFGYSPDSATDGNSTGAVLSAIDALGEDAEATPWQQSDGDNAVKELLALQTDTGAFEYQAGGGDNAFATVQAVPGIAGLAYPVEPQAAGTSPTPAPTAAPTPAPQTTNTAGSVSDSQVTTNSPVTFVGGGFGANMPVSAQLHSEPINLGSYTSDAAGVVQFTFAVPAGAPAGVHTIVATGSNGNGGTNVASAQITVLAAALPQTGDAPVSHGALALVLGILAALLVCAIRVRCVD